MAKTTRRPTTSTKAESAQERARRERERELRIATKRERSIQKSIRALERLTASNAADLAKLAHVVIEREGKYELVAKTPIAPLPANLEHEDYELAGASHR